MFITVIVILLAALSAFLVWASADVGSGVYMHCLCRKKTDKKMLAITFDDGPEPETTPRVLDVLRRHEVKATFFLIGEKAERQPDLVRRLVAEGHTIGNHTYSHSSTSPLFLPQAYKREVERTQEILQSIIGKRVRLFRPPFGVTNPTIARATKHLTSIGWSIRSLDTLRYRKEKDIIDNILKRLHPGAVILLHDRMPHSDQLLDKLLANIKAQGYTPVTIDTLFNIEAYDN